MKKLMIVLAISSLALAIHAQTLYIPYHVQHAYKKGTRSMDGKPGKNYWQNTADYKISVKLSPPNRTITGTETIVYTNNSPDTISNPIIKLILNIHAPGAARQRAVSADYLTKGIIIDKFTENGKEKKLRDAGGNTSLRINLSTPLYPNKTVTMTFDWHYDVSKESGREGMLDSTSFFLAYFYPRVSVYDDIDGWDNMVFTDAQEFYNDFNNYELSITVPRNFLVWATGELQNENEVLQPAFISKFAASKISDKTINVVTQSDLDSKNITTQNEFNTWKWTASNISDVAACISDHYVWDAASVVVDSKTNRRASVQAAYLEKSVNFKKSVEYSHHALDWLSNNWPGVPYPFPASTVVQGFADMEYPMMANDSHMPDPIFQRFVAEHEIAHTWFPFYMGINEHRYGFMDEGWTTAFENLIAQVDLGEEQATDFFKQFRVNNWVRNPSDETQLPIITPANIMSGQGLGTNEYGKPALAYLGLKDMLGDELFRKCLHGFMDRWHGKHPIPWDMFNSFNNLSGKDLNWYWQNWFFSTYYPDIALQKLTPVTNGYTISIENIGGFAIPTNLLVEYVDGSKEKIHYTAAIWEKDQKSTSVMLNTKKKIQYLKLDNGIYMDADESNNSWGKSNDLVFDPTAVKPGDLDKFLGEYASAALPINITFSREGNILFADVTGQGKVKLTQTGANKFEYVDDGAVFEFTEDKPEFVLKQGGVKFSFTKK
ncbi:MAG: M1 family metallopeptidase [Chitinophagaceae bacterium]|nr:M1 family metallopeptidase [Chitinophagaceae bacterium]